MVRPKHKGEPLYPQCLRHRSRWIKATLLRLFWLTVLSQKISYAPAYRLALAVSVDSLVDEVAFFRGSIEPCCPVLPRFSQNSQHRRGEVDPHCRAGLSNSLAGNFLIFIRTMKARRIRMADTSDISSAGAARSRSIVPVLQVKGVSKAYGAVQALQNVDFEVYSGEVVGLVGDNGSGKSTLVKIISGAYTADTGVIDIEGVKVNLTTPKDATRAGIETVYQDLALCDNLDVVSNLFLGREEKLAVVPHVVQPLNELDMEIKASKVFRQLNVKLPSLRVPVASLSGGQRQSIAVAKTILRNAKVAMLDEPTAALGVAQTRQVLELIRRLRAQGLGVVIISHNLADIFEMVDRVVVLRLGRRVAVFDITTATQSQVVAAITGAEFGELPRVEAPGNHKALEEA